MSKFVLPDGSFTNEQGVWTSKWSGICEKAAKRFKGFRWVNFQNDTSNAVFYKPAEQAFGSFEDSVTFQIPLSAVKALVDGTAVLDVPVEPLVLKKGPDFVSPTPSKKAKPKPKAKPKKSKIAPEDM